MGYKRPETVYTLVFDDRDGLEVRAASVSTGRLLHLADMAGQLKTGEAKSLSEVRELVDTFAGRLRSWNIEEDDGTPVPATVEGVLSLEFPFAAEIIVAWFEAIGSVSDPLGGRSTGGLPLEVPSVPMELLSESLSS